MTRYIEGKERSDIATAQHKFNLETRCCVLCGLHEVMLPVVPFCEEKLVYDGPLRRVEEPGLIIEGPDA